MTFHQFNYGGDSGNPTYSCTENGQARTCKKCLNPVSGTKRQSNFDASLPWGNEFQTPVSVKVNGCFLFFCGDVFNRYVIP